MDQETQSTINMARHFQHKKLHGIVVVTLALLSLFIVTMIISEVREWRYIGSGVIPTNTISVQGEGEVFAVPDVATFSFSVIKEGKTAQDAQRAGTETSNKVIEYLKENGIEDKDIKTTGYNLYPRYEQERIVCITFPCQQGERKLVGFELTQSTQVKVRDTGKAGELLSGVGSFGVENISGLSFTIDDEDELKREARQEAVADATEKARALADDLGVKLVRVVNFNEYDSPVFARFESTAFGVGGDSAVSAPKIELGENRIASQVNITYEIR